MEINFLGVISIKNDDEIIYEKQFCEEVKEEYSYKKSYEDSIHFIIEVKK